ncbi:uncharacterized protein EAF02_007694 [Botrytis sinoallii]|uniref:uncharacterized protein n=1 Tax=Botrytis sinoallii TaxID=1463999 RepID=UPI001901E1AA|nr:uncharacterized protein EAF02_007694 [Botrytis sinoallii]KAF7880057.1 hypothetical protein EAF02_007694 [Botrytis sinoallii]
MLIVFCASLFVNTTPVLDPSKPPSSEKAFDIFKFGRADGTVLLPATIDTSLYRDPSDFTVLEKPERKDTTSRLQSSSLAD